MESLSIFTDAELTPQPTVPGRVDLAAGVRWHHRHLAIEGRAGGGAAFTARAGGYVLGARAGVSIGAALPLGRRVAIEPMLAYDLFALWQPTSGSSSPIVQQIGIAAPLTILVFHHVAVEAFVELGLARYRGTNDLVVLAGPRIDIVL